MTQATPVTRRTMLLFAFVFITVLIAALVISATATASFNLLHHRIADMQRKVLEQLLLVQQEMRQEMQAKFPYFQKDVRESVITIRKTTHTTIPGPEPADQTTQSYS